MISALFSTNFYACSCRQPFAESSPSLFSFHGFLMSSLLADSSFWRQPASAEDVIRWEAGRTVSFRDEPVLRPEYTSSSSQVEMTSKETVDPRAKAKEFSNFCDFRVCYNVVMARKKISKSKITAIVTLIISTILIIMSFINARICINRTIEAEKDFYKWMPDGVKCYDCFSSAGCEVAFLLLLLVGCVVSLVGIVFASIAVKNKRSKAKIILVSNIIMLVVEFLLLQYGYYLIDV